MAPFVSNFQLKLWYLMNLCWNILFFFRCSPSSTKRVDQQFLQSGWGQFNFVRCGCSNGTLLHTTSWSGSHSLSIARSIQDGSIATKYSTLNLLLIHLNNLSQLNSLKIHITLYCTYFVIEGTMVKFYLSIYNMIDNCHNTNFNTNLKFGVVNCFIV